MVHPSEKDIIIDEIDERENETERLLSMTKNQNAEYTLCTTYERETRESLRQKKGINFFNAWCIPGVIAYSVSYLCLKFANYGMMLWLPLFLQKYHGYSDYETSSVAAMYDIGIIFGSILFGYLSDLTYSRRAPFAVISLLLAAILQCCLVVVDAQNRGFFSMVIFVLGILVGGAVGIVAGTACADLGK